MVLGQLGEKRLPVQSERGFEYWAYWQGRSCRHGPNKRLVSNIALARRNKAGKETRVAISVKRNKGGRHYLTVHLSGKDYYLSRIAAWCFSNPLNISWDVFNGGGKRDWQAGHLSLVETDCRVQNLRVMTRKQNLDMYKEEAWVKYKTVFRG